MQKTSWSFTLFGRTYNRATALLDIKWSTCIMNEMLQVKPVGVGNPKKRWLSILKTNQSAQEIKMWTLFICSRQNCKLLANMPLTKRQTWWLYNKKTVKIWHHTQLRILAREQVNETSPHIFTICHCQKAHLPKMCSFFLSKQELFIFLTSPAFGFVSVRVFGDQFCPRLKKLKGCQSAILIYCSVCNTSRPIYYSVQICLWCLEPLSQLQHSKA